MKAWIPAILLVGLTAMLVVRQSILSNQSKTLHQRNEENLARHQELLERVQRLEQNLSREAEPARFEPGDPSKPQLADSSEILQRLQALEKEVARIQAKINPEYDPTISPPEPEPDTQTNSKRSWGPEQITGPPEVERDGDSVSAWAALQADSGPEWLSVGFARSVEVRQVRVRESYNAGAITRVSAMANGAEITLWEGTSARGKAPRDFVVSAPPGIQSSSIIVYLDTRRVTGWDEIDAVELVGRDGSRQWATSATASSSYADRSSPPQTRAGEG